MTSFPRQSLTYGMSYPEDGPRGFMKVLHRGGARARKAKRQRRYNVSHPMFGPENYSYYDDAASWFTQARTDQFWSEFMSGDASAQAYAAAVIAGYGIPLIAWIRMTTLSYNPDDYHVGGAENALMFALADAYYSRIAMAA